MNREELIAPAATHAPSLVNPRRGLRLRAGDKVLLFGASVTAQRDNVFEIAFRSIGLDLELVKVGYGGNHLPLTRMLIDELLAQHRPDLCVLDWTSTDYKECCDDTLHILDYVLRRLTEKGCSVLMYYHPRADFDDARVRMIWSCFERVAEHYGVPSIHAYALIEDPLLYLRDLVHVTPEGAERLGALLHGWIGSVRTEGCDPAAASATSIYGSSARPLDIRRVNTESWITFGTDQPLRLDPPEAGAMLEYIEMKVGIYSPVIAIESGAEQRIVPLFDRWCYYERRHFVRASLPASGAVTIRILEEAPIDYAVSKVDISDRMHETRPKKVCLRTLYWIVSPPADVRQAAASSASVMYRAPYYGHSPRAVTTCDRSVNP